MSEKNYFDFVIRAYDATGLRRNSNFFKKIISIYVLLPLLIVQYVMVMMNFRNKDIFGIVEVFEAVSTFGQLLIRKLTLLLYAQKIENVIEKRNKFWNYKICGEDFSAGLYKKAQSSLFRIKIFWTVCFLAVTSIVTIPIFVEENVLPNSCWIPSDNRILYIFVYILQIIFFVELVLLSGPCDAFFLFLCTDLEIQLQLLNRTLQNFKTGAANSTKFEKLCLEKLKKCSAHHRFLLKIHEQVGEIFSIYFILQFVINVIGTTMQFYILSEVTDVTHIMKCVAYISTLNLQGSISFLPASNVEIEAENLSNEIYSIDWYNTSSHKIRKFILFWLMKAQEPLQMTGGGLMTVNRNVFLQIPRTSFSIYTLLR